MRSARTLFSIAPALVLLGGGLLPPARAEAPEGCPGLIASRPSLVAPVALPQDEVGLTFVGHATFLIESPKGVRIATDYSDGSRPPVTPDVATMNKAHATHFSIRPDPAIQHVLKGWNPAGGPAHHDLTVRDVRIRNVSTNIRTYGSATEYDGNSIFVFETARLCIAHLGHLHHTLSPEHLKKLGRIDVLLVPVDGGYTLETFDIVEVLRQINARLMVPMHFFGSSTLNRFLASARAHFPVEFGSTASITLSRETLPTSPKILVLQGH
jgi:L-ascorbate metabolism protein UlaG (beta-lactamase superfamily)